MEALIVSFSHLSRDPRVSRQISWLINRGFRVTTLGRDPSAHPVYKHLGSLPCNTTQTSFRKYVTKASKAARLYFHDYTKFYWNLHEVKHSRDVLSSSVAQRYDLVIANDLETLPLIFQCVNGRKVFLDAHEYAPEMFTDFFIWRYFFQGFFVYLCQEFLPRVDAMVTVSQGIAKKYSEEFQIPMPPVITNAPSEHDLTPSKVNPDHLRLIHHGSGAPSRYIEYMIDLFAFLDKRFTMDLMLVPGNDCYIQKLKKRAAKYPQIQFIPPVAMKQIIPYTNQYDIGVHLLRPSSFNNQHALPNKFFEYIQARLALAIGPSPEMGRLISEYGCGIVSETFNSKALAHSLNALSEADIVNMKQCSNLAAAKLNAEVNERTFFRVLESLTS